MAWGQEQRIKSTLSDKGFLDTDQGGSGRIQGQRTGSFAEAGGDAGVTAFNGVLSGLLPPETASVADIYSQPRHFQYQRSEKFFFGLDKDGSEARAKENLI